LAGLRIQTNLPMPSKMVLALIKYKFCNRMWKCHFTTTKEEIS